jgi:ubiquinone/menaquinone biosynthesis C-methylase UbiE
MNEWKAFFNSYAPKYDTEVFTQNTQAEIEFLVEELGIASGDSILDVGCGTGRHSIGLASRGFLVTGVDISEGMLKIAREKMQKAGEFVQFFCQNALDIDFQSQFDAAICLCEGAMCLLGSEDDPLQRDLDVLRNIHRSLKPKAKFVLNVINGSRHLRAISDRDVAEGRYDLLSMVEVSEMEVETEEGPRLIKVRERGYTPPELRRILETAGFNVSHIYGGTAGAWNRETPRLDEMELMAIATRSQ